jgi:molybdate transport system substrate-binding protein
MQVSLLSGGAAQGLVEALAPRFKAETGYTIAGSFGAVGAMRDRLLSPPICCC